jgi:hypothetical protein
MRDAISITPNDDHRERLKGVHLAVQAAVKAGVCILPPSEDGKKKPQPKTDGQWKDYQKRLPTTAEYRRWYPGRSGLGAVCGAISRNLEAFEFDHRDTHVAFVELAHQAGLGDLIARLGAGYLEDSPRGVHYLYRCATIAGNIVLARRLIPAGERTTPGDKVTTLIETRGEGGFIILAPSNGKVSPSGKPYVLRAGGFATIPTITPDERRDLHQLAQSFDEMPTGNIPPASEPKAASGERPGDDYSRKTTWAQILEPHGWKAIFTHGDVTHWRRPGKDRGTSATTNIHGSDLLYVFSSSTPFEAERGYGKFAVYAILNHGGDFAAAARDLAAQGYGEPPRASGGTTGSQDTSGQTNTEPGRDTAPVVPEPYHFDSAVPDDHFVSQWIHYADQRTDAAHEFHELAALSLLAAATPNVRARLTAYPNGMGTNIYGLFVAESTTSRKSTSKDLSRDVLSRTLPDSLCSDAFSPEGFVEQLAGRPRQSTMLFVDEFGELLSKLHHAPHMAGMRGLLLTIYSGDSYRYHKHSKRTKEGARVLDEDSIEDPHLSILGATTPAVFDMLTESDVISGLLPRFVIVMPTAKPARRPFFEMPPAVDILRNSLIVRVAKLHEWAAGGARAVHFEPGVLQALDDDFFVGVEQAGVTESEVGRAMLSRLPALALKLCLLVAAGRADTIDHPALTVTREDAEAATTIARRWQGYALAFAARIGESDFERKLQRVLTVVRQRHSVPRHVLARLAHVEKKTLDAIRDTLVDRGHLAVVPVKADMGRPGELWRLDTTEGKPS